MVFNIYYAKYYFCFTFQILKDLPTVDGRPGASMPPMDFDSLKADMVENHGNRVTDYDVSSYSMYPKVIDYYNYFSFIYYCISKKATFLEIIITGNFTVLLILIV